MIYASDIIKSTRATDALVNLLGAVVEGFRSEYLDPLQHEDLLDAIKDLEENCNKPLWSSIGRGKFFCAEKGCVRHAIDQHDSGLCEECLEASLDPCADLEECSNEQPTGVAA